MKSSHVAATPKDYDQVITKQENAGEITPRLVDYYQPVRVYFLARSLARKPVVTRDRTATWISVSSCRMMHHVNFTGRALRGVGTAVDVVRFPLTDFEGGAAYVVSSLACGGDTRRPVALSGSSDKAGCPADS